MTDLLSAERSSDILAIKGFSPKALVSAASSPNTKTGKTGADFETMVLSELLKPMFEGLSSDGLFGGGEGEEAFKSVYVDAIAKQITQKGGIGISSVIQSELIRMQGSAGQ